MNLIFAHEFCYDPESSHGDPLSIIAAGDQDDLSSLLQLIGRTINAYGLNRYWPHTAMGRVRIQLISGSEERETLVVYTTASEFQDFFDLLPEKGKKGIRELLKFEGDTVPFAKTY